MLRKEAPEDPRLIQDTEFLHFYFRFDKRKEKN